MMTNDATKQAKFTHYVTSGFGMADDGWTAYHNKYKQTHVANRLYQSQLEVLFPVAPFSIQASESHQ